MSTKLEPGKFDWYAAALPDEPYFIVLARDDSAPRIVRDWADRRELEISQGERPRRTWIKSMRRATPQTSWNFGAQPIMDAG